MSDSNKTSKVEIMHRLNKLKLKAGADLGDGRAGFIDPLALHKAQKAIDDKEKEYDNELNTVLVQLDSVWTDMRKMTEEKKIKKAQDQMFNFANHVKDLAETYNYHLMKHFGQSLRDFCTKFNVENKAHHIIIQAHMDVMRVAFEQGIKDEGGPAAQELKLIVAKAIEVHS